MSDSTFSDVEESNTLKGQHKDAFSLPAKKNASRFSEDELPKLQGQNRIQDHGTLTTPIRTIKKSSHSRANSTSFEEYSTRSGFSHHKRGDSSSKRTTSLRRRSYDSSIVLVGIHNNQNDPGNETPPHGKTYVKINSKIKANKRFSRILLAQTLAVDTSEVYATSSLPVNKVDDQGADNKQPFGAVWASRFSKDGKYLATGGQNCVVNIWKVLRDIDRNDNIEIQDINPHEQSVKVFHDTPVRTYTGHTADILDISWSKNNFIATSSMDKTVRLWHISQKVCLCVFRHLDVVTSVRFHPKDDRFFLSGSLDCKVRLWSIPEKRVAFWNEIPAGNMVTAVGFTLDGRTACVGANTGDLFFFETQGLKYNTQIVVKKHRNKHGKKVTGIEPMPCIAPGEERILVTTNDSRLWIINMKDKSYVSTYKGLSNSTMQIKGSFSDDGRYIVCGSEDNCVYLWCTDQVGYSPFQRLHESRMRAAAALGYLGDQMLHHYNENFTAAWLRKGEKKVTDKLRSRNEHFLAHQHIVTSAIFAPTKTRQQLAKTKGDIIFDFTPVYTHREVNNDSDSVYTDAVSQHKRKSIASSTHSIHYNNMDELQQLMMEELEGATLEERAHFDYPDSQIIISTDLHGAIKVWRMDSGVYNREDCGDSQNSGHYKRSTVAPMTVHGSDVIGSPSTASSSTKKGGLFSKLFHKRSK